jgi:hypothetical protein
MSRSNNSSGLEYRPVSSECTKTRRVIVAINILGLLFRYQERSQTYNDIQSETRTETTMNIRNSRNKNIKKDNK